MNTYKKSLINISIVFLIIGTTNGVEFLLERVELDFVDGNHIRDPNVSVRRASRKSRPLLNISGHLLRTWDNNVTAIIRFDEYLHNEYRPSFVELRFKVCDLLDSPYLHLKKIFKIKCPLTPMFYNLTNIAVHGENFPNVFPLERGRANVTFAKTKDNTRIISGFLYASFHNK